MLRRYEDEDNPGFENTEEHGDLWAAINKCYVRIAVSDERSRVAFMFVLPILGFIVALLIALLGIVIAHMGS